MASSKYYRNPRVHVELLKGSDTERSPRHVLEMLDGFKRTYRLNQADEFWMVIDFDRWGEEKLGDMASLCWQKNYRMAVSRPCFELWLLLHLCSLEGYSALDLQEMLMNERVTKKKTRLQKEMARLSGSYNKERLKTSDFLPFVQLAIDRARYLDIAPENRWPSGLGSRVYLLAEQIIGGI